MVSLPRASVVLFILALPALAQSPTDRFFPTDRQCYARSYTDAHLADHPAQRVTRMEVRPDQAAMAPYLGLWVNLTLRGVPGGAFEALAQCENIEDQLYCTMEGDAGAFSLTAAKGGAVLLSVGSRGMGFENEVGFTTLERDQGDDRSFLLRPVACR